MERVAVCPLSPEGPFLSWYKSGISGLVVAIVDNSCKIDKFLI